MAVAGTKVPTRDTKKHYVKFVFVAVDSVATAVVGREKLVAVTVTVTDVCCSSKGSTT